MTYYLEQPNKCNKCGSEYKCGGSSSQDFKTNEREIVCKFCLDKFIKNNCGIMEFIKD